ncbi:MAG: RsmE family RNA methyltransferase [Polyangiaceae bacterium]|nr:RsmE family RNA methyltransferase [Polyangiaceae bacterium]
MSRRHRVPVETLVRGELALSAEAAKYVCRVLRVAVGDSLELFDPSEAIQADAEVLSCEPTRVVCRVGIVSQATAIPKVKVVLVQGMSKGDRVERVMKDATALAVSEVMVTGCERSVLPAPHAEDTRMLRWRRIALEAARQSGRGDVPRITVTESLVDVMDSIREGFKVVLDPQADATLSEHLVTWERLQRIVVAVGPEGGFSPAEISEFERQGWLRAALGPFTLRTELAPAVALAQISAHAHPKKESSLG